MNDSNTQFSKTEIYFAYNSSASELKTTSNGNTLFSKKKNGAFIRNRMQSLFVSALLSLFFILTTQLNFLSAQVEVFPGEAPIQLVVERTGNFGVTSNSSGAFSTSFNRARGILSIGAEVQSDFFASWNMLDVHVFYNGTWVPIFRSTHRPRGGSPFETAVNNNTTAVTSPFTGVNAAFQNSLQYAWDVVNGTDFRNVHQSHSGGHADNENNIYLKNFNNLHRYNFTYLPLGGSVVNRVVNANTPNWSLQFDNYTSTQRYPVFNGANPAGNVTSGYDNGNFNSAGNIDGINYVQFSANWGIMVFNISNLPPEMLSASSFKVRMYVHHELNTQNRIYITTYNNQNPMSAAPNGLTASNNICNQTTLNWSNSSNTLPTEAPMTLNNVIFRNGVYLGMVNANVTTYDDITALQNVTYNYSVRHVAFTELGKTYYQSNPSNIVAGQIKPTPELAVSPLATQNRCNGEVELTWQYNQTSPASFRVDRATSLGGTYTTIANTVAGTGRLYLDNTVIRGTTYFYRIYTRNDCGTMSLGAAEISGISPSDPLVATGLTTAVSGLGLLVSWVDNAINETKYQVVRVDDQGNNVVTDLNVNSTSY